MRRMRKRDASVSRIVSLVPVASIRLLEVYPRLPCAGKAQIRRVRLKLLLRLLRRVAPVNTTMNPGQFRRQRERGALNRSTGPRLGLNVRD